MARPEKSAVVTDVRDRMTGASATMLTEYRGLTVSQLARLRAELRKAGAEYRVVKNTLTKIAVRDAGYEVPDELLTGPTAITICGDDPVAAAKALRTFAKDNPQLVVKGAILEGRFIDAGETSRLADLASREELLAELAGMMQAVIAQPARLALASLSKAARLFAALQEKRAAAGETMDAPPPAPAEAPAAADESSDEPTANEATVEGTTDSATDAVPVVDDTPEPDSADAAAVTEAAADAGANATPGATGPEGPAANTEPERAAADAADDASTGEADANADAEAGTLPPSE